VEVAALRNSAALVGSIRRLESTIMAARKENLVIGRCGPDR